MRQIWVITIYLVMSLRNMVNPLRLEAIKEMGCLKGKIYDAVTRLRIDFSSSSEPAFKSNVERVNEVAQAFLPYFLMKNNINSLKNFKDDLESIIDSFNDYNNWSIPAENSFENVDIDEFFIIEERRVVSEISHISWNNKSWAPFNKEKRILMNKSVYVYIDLKGLIYTKHKMKFYILKKSKYYWTSWNFEGKKKTRTNKETSTNFPEYNL